MTYTYAQLKDAIAECTSYTLELHVDDDDEQCYVLLDGCGDPDGEPWYDLDDVADYVCNNQQVEEYLNTLTN